MTFWKRSAAWFGVGVVSGAAGMHLLSEGVHRSPSSQWWGEEHCAAPYSGRIPVGNLKAVYARFFGPPPSTVVHAQSVSTREKSSATATSQTAVEETEGGAGEDIPNTLRSRFLHYARREAVTEEYVLNLDDFLACLLLLPRSRYDAAPEPSGGATSATEAAEKRVALLHSFPPHVQRRAVEFFKVVDMDKSNTINYAEFVALFTMLSTNRRTLRAAFRMFDEESKNRLSETEFIRMLNTIMVDPTVQVVLEGSQEATPPSPPSAGSPSPSTTPSEPASLFASSLFSTAGGSRKMERQRRSAKHHLTFTIPVSVVQRFAFAPLPIHKAAPPGSTHRSIFGGPSKRVLELQRVAEKDTAAGAVSFEPFWYRVDYLRWELRAIEFGMYDPKNTGYISLSDCRSILRRDAPSASTAVSTAPSTASKAAHGVSGDAATSTTSSTGLQYAVRPSANSLLPPRKHLTDCDRCVSWQFYQKVFEVIRDSDKVLPSLNLALEALPPARPDALVHEAIPDGDISARLHEAQETYASAVRARRGRANGGSEMSDSDAGLSSGTDAAVSLVRPTSLTWRQFSRVLASVDGLPPLSEEEQRLFFELFDDDLSGTISPSEFGRLCALKGSFFAPYLPRFTEKQRNVLQKFFFCMQQLEADPMK